MKQFQKLDRLKQWGKERMGSDVKTDTSDEFKALEMEMQLRHEGMERMHKSMTSYVKSLSKRKEAEDKEKTLPVAYFGSTMVSHGDDFEPDSEFGQCLASLGRANERVARMQETYTANATTSWLESLERSLAQMKEYQVARKKLDSRRLAYDTCQAKMQKSKKEDFKMEEELRSQKAKYEESSEDVYRRMLDIKEAEVDSVGDLTSFLDAELTYYDRCREVLMQLKRDWPAASPVNRTSSPVNGGMRRPPQTRSRSNTATSLADRFQGIEEEPLEPPARPTISSRLPSGQNSPRRELPGFDLPVRPAHTRTATFEGPQSLGRAGSPAPMPRLSRVPTDPTLIMASRSNLRVTKRDSTVGDVFGDDYESMDGDRAYGERSESPVSSFGAMGGRTPSWSTGDNGASATGRKMPPPPPPSRSKKPPPPPPLKRSALSTSEVPYA